MTFRECMNILKEKYDGTAALTFMVTVHKGVEYVDISAHGGGKVVTSARTYRGALAELEALNSGVTEEPGEEARNG